MPPQILALTDALGNLVRFVLLPGHRFNALFADKAFDSNAIIADLNERGAKIVISQHPRRAKPLPLDTKMDKWRHLIENFFCKLKEFKRIAMRADQDRPKLQRQHLSRRCRHKLTMNLNRPLETSIPKRGRHSHERSKVD